jgi:hypothetical protein
MNEDSPLAHNMAIARAQRVLANRLAPKHERDAAERVLSKAGINPASGVREVHWAPGGRSLVFPQMSQSEAKLAVERLEKSGRAFGPAKPLGR